MFPSTGSTQGDCETARAAGHRSLVSMWLNRRPGCLATRSQRAYRTHGRFGIFGPHHKLRKVVSAKPNEKKPEENAEPQIAATQLPAKKKKTKIDFATVLKRTFGFDLFTCPWCHGHRKVVQVLKTPSAAEAFLKRREVAVVKPVFAHARAPPQEELWESAA